MFVSIPEMFLIFICYITGNNMPGFAIGMMSSGNIIVTSAPTSVTVPSSRVPLSNVVSVVSTAQSVPPALPSQYPAVVDGNI
jgi:hypothetical protein